MFQWFIRVPGFAKFTEFLFHLGKALMTFLFKNVLFVTHIAVLPVDEVIDETLLTMREERTSIL